MMGHLKKTYTTNQETKFHALTTDNEDSFEELVIFTSAGSFHLTEEDLSGMLELLQVRRRYMSN